MMHFKWHNTHYISGRCLVFLLLVHRVELINKNRDFPGVAVVKNPPLNAGDTGSIPGQGTRSHMHAATKSLPATTKEPTDCN